MIDQINSSPLQIGIIGTGYTAKRRAEALKKDPRVRLTFINGHNPENALSFSAIYQVPFLDSWPALVHHPQVDCVIVCTINQLHAEIVYAALSAGKHVIVEYPLAFDPTEAKKLLSLAKKQDKLLHIEHIELLGGLHQAIRQYLPQIGQVFYARYTTFKPEHPAPRRWTYHKHQFGFPLVAALSRIHRFTDLFGTVTSVYGQNRYEDAPETDYFTTCLCQGHLQFSNGLRVDIIYGKGERFWRSDRTLEIHGEKGLLLFEGEKGQLIQGDQVIPLEVGTRRGLFALDTQMVFDHLFEGKPLYISPQESVYALRVADAVYQSARSGQPVNL